MMFLQDKRKEDMIKELTMLSQGDDDTTNVFDYFSHG